MTPISLTIQGLYSYQKKQSIDFTKLTAAGLFGIFGGVGSGKSTILEAITFAIYGETDRPKARQPQLQQMNLKRTESINFIFAQVQMHLLSWMGREKANGSMVKAIERTAYKSVDGTWSFRLKALENAAGLIHNSAYNYYFLAVSGICRGQRP